MAVQPDNSGGPLVTDAGLVVGIVVAKLSAAKTFEATGSIPENVSFAVKASELAPLLRGLALPREPKIKQRGDAIAHAQGAVCQVLASSEPAPPATTDATPDADDDTTHLSKPQVATTIAAMGPRLRPCRTSHDSSPFEQVTVIARIRPTGEVESVTLVDPGAERDSRARCVGFVFKATRFPATAAGANFKYTVKLDG